MRHGASLVALIISVVAGFVYFTKSTALETFDLALEAKRGVSGDVPPFLAAQSMPVQTLSWPRGRGSSFVDRIVRGGVPLVIRGSPITRWAAMDKWTPSYLATHLPAYVEVHNSSRQGVRMHSQVQPFGSIANVTWRRPWETANVSSVRLLGQHSDRGNWMYRATLKELPVALRRDLGSTAALVETEESYAKPFNVMETNIWITPNVTSTAHYDLPHNLYTQVYGRKRFVLFSPEYWPRARLFPRLHPSTRMAQTSAALLNWSPEEIASLPQMFRDINEIPTLEVVLEPGETLYIPPYYGHHVSALGISVSVSVHVESDAVGLRDRVHAFQLPDCRVHEDRRNFRSTLAKLVVFLGALFPSYSGAAALVEQLVNQRYGGLVHDSDVDGLWDALENGSTLFNKMILASESNFTIEDASLRKRAHLLSQSVFQLHPAAIAHIELMNYVEDVVCFAVVNPALALPSLRWLAKEWGK